LQQNGRRVPEDVAVIARGYHPDAALVHPSLSTYVFPLADAAALAGSLLLERQDEPPDTHMLQMKFECHESCGTGRGG
jgi:DNA-binding LacI/PurR family transcriptional regulator